jgi:hypothetical protein
MPVILIEIVLCENYNCHWMRSIAHSIPISEADQGLQLKGQHSGTLAAGCLMEVLDRFELTDSRLLVITIENTSSNYLVTRELLTTVGDSNIEWPTLRNHNPGMAHVTQLGLGAFMGGLGAKGRTKSWGGHERNEQFGGNESTDSGKSERLRKEDNARINKVSAMRPGFAKIIEKVRVSTYFETAETDLH